MDLPAGPQSGLGSPETSLSASPLPCATQTPPGCPHHRIQRSRQAARWLHDTYLTIAAHMSVGFAIRHRNKLDVLHVCSNQVVQAVLCPRFCRGRRWRFAGGHSLPYRSDVAIVRGSTSWRRESRSIQMKSARFCDHEIEPNASRPAFKKARRSWRGTGPADIVLGILSYNSAETIRGAIETAQAGLATYFPGKNCVLVNADGGSKDGTQALAAESIVDKKDFVQISYPIFPVHKLNPEYYGVPGKSNALRAVFNAAIERNATACAVVDSNVRSLTPEWVEALTRPVIENASDFVSPCYLRHKYEGTIINGIVYPLTRALYGKRIQQPIGGEFALSRKFIETSGGSAAA